MIKPFRYLTLLACFASCQSRETLFKAIPSSESGISFNNEVIESSRLNILQYEYMYNGGGVGVGDFNNDGLPDIYFTGNRVPNKLYINRGNMKFEDVTAASNTAGGGKWSKGVALVDINNDGLLDIYVCAAVLKPAALRKNLLYINKGADAATKIPVFEESAEAYGLADSSSTQMAAFFDYDNDGDLDVYLLVNELDEHYPNQFRVIKKDGSSHNTDRLLQNNFNESLKHAVFTDVSAATGITWEGHGLGLHIADINDDGWKDIYVGNDYISNNLLYINDHGKFTNRCDEYFKHSSRNAMGNDIADLNNDGLQDLVELDMMPEDNSRQKRMNNPTDYQTFINTDRFGYMHQYARNTLQLNQGPRMLANDTIGEPVFSEVAFFAGVAQTDWSWSALAVDLDNDSHRDLIISNGLPKDLTDLDFMAFREKANPNTPLPEMLKQLPTALVSNYAYRNRGDLQFEDKTADWGWDFVSASAGMAYADFDLDGDLDMVLNNTNGEASLLQNNLIHAGDTTQHYLRVQLKGDGYNRNGIGATIRIYDQGRIQMQEYTPYRGYLSSVENIVHFGLGAHKTIDSIQIKWPDGRVQTEKNLSVNRVFVADIAKASAPGERTNSSINTQNWFTDITASLKADFLHQEDDDIDFNLQRQLPRKLSQFGPAIAAGDLNGDGLDDFVVGGDASHPAIIFLQTNNGFSQQKLWDQPAAPTLYEMGICLFDVEGDGDLDVFIATGGNKSASNRAALYEDQLYLNDGKANFTRQPAALPASAISKSCVKAADFDHDGDLDLFVGGRLLPGYYPKPVSSAIYRNDSKNGLVKFTDVTKEVAPMLIDFGLVTDAIWTDADNDGTPDLLITGEWMPLTVLKNNAGKFSQAGTGISKLTGWWNSITGADIDNDGDIDYIVGNFGENGYLQASDPNPVRVYAKDFDKNSSYDALFSTYLPTTPHGKKDEFPLAPRDMMIEQIAKMRVKYPNYKSYAKATMDDVLVPQDKEGALQLSVSNFSTGYFENKGGFDFVFHRLPSPAQFSSIFGIVADDFDQDGNVDLLLNGNDFSMAPMWGRSDALNGLMLKGDGKGGFKPLSIMESGIYIPGNGKAAAQLAVQGNRLLAVTQNRGGLKLYKSSAASKLIQLLPTDIYGLIENANGTKRKQEFYYGSSFLSQSSRSLLLSPDTRSITITNAAGATRTVR